jgi:glycosyltransferase involved in cell wall biosynthesis
VQTEISVLMSVYNGQPFLGKAVSSILTQSFSDFDFIIVNDGSTDSSLKILQEYEVADKRVRVLNRPNTGMVGALNEGFAICQGKYIARMDADDIADPKRLERQLTYFQSHPNCVLLGGQGIYIDSDGDSVGRWIVPLSHEEIDNKHIGGSAGCIIHPAATFLSSAFERVGLFDPAYPTAQDLDLWLKLAEVGRVANLPEVMVYYRLHLQNMSFRQEREQRKEVQTIVNQSRYRRGITEPIQIADPATPSTCKRSRQEGYVWMAINNQFDEAARKHARKLVRQFPLAPRSWYVLAMSLADSERHWIGRLLRKCKEMFRHVTQRK